MTTNLLMTRDELAEWIHSRTGIKMHWRHWRLWSEAGLPTIAIPGAGLHYDPEAVWAWLRSFQGTYKFTHGNNQRRPVEAQLHHRRPRKSA